MKVTLKLTTELLNVALETFNTESAEDYYTLAGCSVDNFGSYGYSKSENLYRYCTSAGNYWELDVTNKTLSYSGRRGALHSVYKLLPLEWEEITALDVLTYSTSEAGMHWFETLGTYLVRTEDADGLLDYLPIWGNKRLDKKNIMEVFSNLPREIQYALNILHNGKIGDALLDGTGLKYRRS